MANSTILQRRTLGVNLLQLVTFLVVVPTAWRTVHGFQLEKSLDRKSHGRQRLLRSRTPLLPPLSAFNYGRGADIWPECNEDPVQLQDSFPNGQIPYSAIMAVDMQDMAAVHNSFQESIASETTGPELVDNSRRSGKKRRAARFLVSKTVRRLLRRAAAREELDSEQAALDATQGIWDRMPLVIAMALLVKGLVRPLDVGGVAILTTYYIILNMVARSPREGGLAPIMPATPPQGHVPMMVSNPLGIGTLYSTTYDIWLKVGIVLGLVAPLIQVADYIFRRNDIDAARICARPIFWLCCQAMSEVFSRQVMTPLPIRILIPVSYNAVRLSFLWNWACTTSSTLGVAGRALAVGNLAYWTLNLMAFLIPVAIVRYMRAHFYGVEAAEVTTRIGMEDSLGLVPHIQ